LTLKLQDFIGKKLEFNLYYLGAKKKERKKERKKPHQFQGGVNCRLKLQAVRTKYWEKGKRSSSAPGKC